MDASECSATTPGVGRRASDFPPAVGVGPEIFAFYDRLGVDRTVDEPVTEEKGFVFQFAAIDCFGLWNLSFLVEIGGTIPENLYLSKTGAGVSKTYIYCKSLKLFYQQSKYLFNDA